MWLGKVAVLTLSISIHGLVSAQGFTFALLAKSVNDHNFREVWRGCIETAALNGNLCLLFGPEGSATPRTQLKALKQGLSEHKVDALAVSVIHSALLASYTNGLDIPIFSFDSPFSEALSSAAKGYIGIDNQQFGRKLGALAQQFRPQGGTLCLMTAENDPNLLQRTQGVRAQLSGDDNWPKHKRLANNAGWTEVHRCPWYSGDSVERSVQQLKITLEKIHPDVFISVGHWPIVNPQHLKSTLGSTINSLSSSNTILIAATGAPSPDQLKLIDENIFDGYVSIDFHEMGSQIAKVMGEEMRNELDHLFRVETPFKVYTNTTK